MSLKRFRDNKVVVHDNDLMRWALKESAKLNVGNFKVKNGGFGVLKALIKFVPERLRNF